MQEDLFNTSHQRDWQLDNGCHIQLTTDFLDTEKARTYFHLMQDQLQWELSEIRIAGRMVKIPRLNAWYGDADAYYQYSGVGFSPKPWTKELLNIRDEISTACSHHFNSVLANLYRDGQDSVAWHADDEAELGQNPVIASLSLGETRRFLLRPIDNQHAERLEIHLPHNSLLLMSGALQHHWHHQIPKSAVAKGARINLTFRHVHKNIKVK